MENSFGKPLNIIAGVLILAVVWAVAVYNALIRFSVKVQEALSNIDVQTKRRYDLVPNLIETVKGYAKHERETLDSVVAARNRATEIKVDTKNMTPEQMQAFVAAQDGLSGTLGKLFALSENYPDLKASDNFKELQRELEDTEDKIESARAGYNAAVAVYNMKTQTFPAIIVAKIFSMNPKEMFEVTSKKEREVVKVDFGTSEGKEKSETNE